MYAHEKQRNKYISWHLQRMLCIAINVGLLFLIRTRPQVLLADSAHSCAWEFWPTYVDGRHFGDITCHAPHIVKFK
jgi:hypothetical protein